MEDRTLGVTSSQSNRFSSTGSADHRPSEDPQPVYLSHVDELSEDLGSLLGRVSAEDHQLHPLGDSITHHDRALQGRVVPHRASHHVAPVVQELSGQTGNNICRLYRV